METLYFAYGVLAMIAATMIAVIVVGTVKVMKMQSAIRSLEQWIANVENTIDSRISKEIEGMHDVINDDRRDLLNRIDELNRYVDSRFDKLENKLTGNSAKKQIKN